MPSVPMLSCETLLARLSELEEEVVDPTDLGLGPELAAHTRECPTCGRAVEEWRAWHSLEVPRLAESIQPSRDLWPEIANQLTDRGLSEGGLQTESRWRSRARIWALAATVLFLLVSVGVVSRFSSQSRDGRSSPTQGSLASSPSAADLARYEDRQVAQHKELIATLATKRTVLEPELIAVLERDLQALEDAIGGIRQAMVESPEDGRLDRMLADRYRQEARLLRVLQRI